MNMLPIKSTNTDGTVFWKLHGQNHRENGPAIEFANGTKEWWLDGKLHRENGPAIEDSNDYRAWYLHNKFIKTAGGLK